MDVPKAGYGMSGVLKALVVWEKCSLTSGTRLTNGTRRPAG
jgi:hypothetical protein